MNKDKGFSLIELLIVVVIIGILAAIAIPSLIASRRAANEASAVSAIHNLATAQMTYQATAGTGNFAGATTADTTGLAMLSSRAIIDSALGGGTKTGYGFIGAKVDATGTTPASFWFSACPTAVTGTSATGTRVFGIQTDSIIHYQTNLVHFADSAEIGSANILAK